MSINENNIEFNPEEELMEEGDEELFSLPGDAVPEGSGEPTADGLYEHFRFVADKGQGQIRVDKFLVDRIVGTSRNRVQRAADGGYILVNGKPEKSSYKVKPLDVVCVMMDRPRHVLEILPEDIPLDIVYEDDDLLVVNKPAGLVVHPGCGNYHGTLVNALAWHFKDDPKMKDMADPRMGLVHRIDKETSGLLVVAKNENARTDLSLQFFKKTTRRLYNALLWGHVEDDEGTVVGNIGRSPKDRLQMCVFPDGDQGKPAVTHYRVLERLGYVSFVECRLETGRTHQIRVHMKHIGHTLFNDSRYGGDQILKGTTFARYSQFVRDCFATCPRQALHARTLGFRHPRTGEEMDFECPLPQDMVALVDAWRKYIENRNNQ